MQRSILTRPFRFIVFFWYEGPYLIEALDNVHPPKRSTDKPLCVPIQDVFKISGIGTVPVGQVETGIMRPGQHVLLAPTGVTTDVKSIEMHHAQMSQAGPGDNIGFNIKNMAVRDFKRGDDVCSDATKNPAPGIEFFEAQVIIMSHPGKIHAGYTPIVDCHTAHCAYRFDKLLTKMDRRPGKVLEEDPEFLKAGEGGMVSVVPTKPLCLESFTEFPPLEGLPFVI